MLLNKSFKESVHSVLDPFMERGVTTIATYNKDPIPFNKNLHSSSGTIRLHQARLTGFRRVVLEWRQQFCQMERNILVPLKVDHLQRLCLIRLSDQAEMFGSI